MTVLLGRSASFRRQAYAIHAYVGKNGSGKTHAAVRDTLPALDAGLPVLSTVDLLDAETGKPHPLFVPLMEPVQLLDFAHGVVLFDEVAGIASSRESNALPFQIVNWLMQLRRLDVQLRWTAPNWARADKVIREVTQAVTLCRGLVGESVPMTDGAGDMRRWQSNRVFISRTYDAFEFDEWTSTKRERLKSVCKELYWRGADDRAARSYDTFRGVHSLGTGMQGGTCSYCGGRRTPPKCNCGDRGDAAAIIEQARQRVRVRVEDGRHVLVDDHECLPE